MKNVALLPQGLLIRNGHWLERFLLRFPYWAVGIMESARVGNDTNWTLVRWRQP